jgi:catechol 2,3-dioxygenase-like lactoylglutathione lyase family enzyme
MKPHITVITLGVNDLEKSVKFYREGLGLPSQGIVGTEYDQGAVAFFDLKGGLKLALFPRSSIATDANVPLENPSATEFTLAQNVSGKAEVDAIMEQAQKVGAAITDPAHDRFWGGYSGYFQDPDGHLWEIAWDPDLEERATDPQP